MNRSAFFMPSSLRCSKTSYPPTKALITLIIKGKLKEKERKMKKKEKSTVDGTLVLDVLVSAHVAALYLAPDAIL